MCITAQLQESSIINLICGLDQEYTIQLATDWADGEARFTEKSSHSHTGFIGMGSSKHGIYARFEGKEYVLTQPLETTLDGNYVEEVLGAEFKLLYQCDRFKSEFDKYAQAEGMSGIPDFYSNFKGAIFGELHGTKLSNSCIVPYRMFLATPLLPTKIKIHKFTGNDLLGDADLDDGLTMAIHAFTHFLLMYSYDYMIFRDLQGMLWFKAGTMCLIDPQAHT
ncbi:hypothetical protein P691DRAFT_838580 [Macrolepiota fuliginosa MF-IS2]|uniref:Alpha-type protein kinase domain-containing protein n=1 Tax=Macrolepiota fuliginosa MF-IS2 TaxID=1400762 RepID=A0A9P5XIC4_9AGAR|nr:hypothetical protein P691DRAFT_838580 [Macrolepiota fuliginosa MF-IS2]